MANPSIEPGVGQKAEDFIYKLKSYAKVLDSGVYARHLLQAGFNKSLTPIELAGFNDWLKPAWSQGLA